MASVYVSCPRCMNHWEHDLRVEYHWVDVSVEGPRPEFVVEVEAVYDDLNRPGCVSQLSEAGMAHVEQEAVRLAEDERG